MVGTIILAVVVGAIIGVVARLVMPGKQHIGAMMTIVLGALGGLTGSWLASHFEYQNTNGGIAWLPFFAGVGAAAIFIAIYESVTDHHTHTRLPH
ncbi:GlsB/YeaQ/YmgE family stress response membrane protein [Mycobacterium sp.]|uniref:GlsB/YeaQ/YmgE family stress response membrane protein n=1 Tax=Mycobacterium sp. TaxID=1785 RepID=UPI003A86159F